MPLFDVRGIGHNHKRLENVTLFKPVEATADRMLRIGMVTAVYIAEESILIGNERWLVLFLGVRKVLHCNGARHVVYGTEIVEMMFSVRIAV